MPYFAPARPGGALPHLGLRLGLLVKLDPQGQKAWAEAAGDAGKARRLSEAGIPCPPTEDACRPWINALLRPSTDEHAGLRAWVQSLSGEEGQRWRNRALWTAALALQGDLVACLLKGGAQGVPHGALQEAGGPRDDRGLPLLAQLLKAVPPTRTPRPSETEIMETVASWVSAEPGALTKALAALAEAGCALRPFEAESLQWLGAMGASFAGPAACPWFDALMAAAHAPLAGLRNPTGEQADMFRHLQQEPVRALFSLGACVNVRWPNGDTLLHRLLRSWSHRSTSTTEGLVSWFGFLRQHGADPHALLPSGDTLLHTVFRHEDGVFFPRALVDMLVALRPSDVTTPAADGATPLFLLERQLQAAGHSGDASAAQKIRMGAAQAHFNRLRF